MTFQVGRAGPAALLDYALLANPLLRPFNRVIVMVTFNAMPHVLMDGIIARQELAQGHEPGTSTLTIKGEDVSVMMDREERSAEHPAQNEMLIAAKLILSYAQYGLIPVVIPPMSFDVPIPIERIPVQQGTDLEYLRDARRSATATCSTSRRARPRSPTTRTGARRSASALPQRAITVNMGPETNATLDEAAKDGLGADHGRRPDPGPRRPNQKIRSRRSRACSRRWRRCRPGSSTWPNVRKQQLRESGPNSVQAMAQAQGAMEATIDGVKVDRRARRRQLRRRAAGARRWSACAARASPTTASTTSRSVTHKISLGRYTQRFELAREGLGSTTPMVPV